MNRNPYNIVFLISLVIGFLGLLVGLARAQSPDCPGVALVQVQPGFTLNVRTLPGGVGQILGTVNHASGELRATEEQAGFLHIEQGWIINRYLSVTCWSFGTLTPSSTATIILSTRMPQPTPTQIQHNFVWCSSEPEIRRIGDSWMVECRR